MRLRRPKRPDSIRIYDPAGDVPRSPERRENLEVEVDAILEKIQAQGEASLSDHEREHLENGEPTVQREPAKPLTARRPLARPRMPRGPPKEGDADEPDAS